MPYIGKEPAAVPINASDIPDNSITSAKIVDGVIIADDIGAGQVSATELATNSVTNVKVADDAIGIAELSSTGTANTSTFLRGDNSWTVVDTTKEGTAVLSTGESTTTKVLRTDGDGSSSWQTGVFLGTDQSWTGSQRGTPSVVTDGTLDLNTANNFKYTPAASPDTLEFTNETAGQSGFITVINASGHTIATGSEVKKSATWDVSTAGTYLVSYYSDGTNVYLSASAALAT